MADWDATVAAPGGAVEGEAENRAPAGDAKGGSMVSKICMPFLTARHRKFVGCLKNPDAAKDLLNYGARYSAAFAA